ncbi:unnamed protein product [Knipowitschia caucasica]
MSQQAITDIEVSLNQADEQQLQGQGFHRINEDLNQGCWGYPVYIWYKRQPGVDPITRIQISFVNKMNAGLTDAGYQKLDKNLIPGSPVYLWYFKGQTEYDTPIVNLEVSTQANDDALKMKLGLERVGYNLNRSRQWMQLWMKREKPTYICDVTATNSFGSDADLFGKGYIRIDDTTNTMWWGGITSNFLWYRQTTDKNKALTNLQISNNTNQNQQWQQQGYKLVNVNLNEGTGGNAVYLWYKKVKGENPVKTLLLLSQLYGLTPFEKIGATIIQEGVNPSYNGPQRYLCYYNQ